MRFSSSSVSFTALWTTSTGTPLTGEVVLDWAAEFNFCLTGVILLVGGMDLPAPWATSEVEKVRLVFRSPDRGCTLFFRLATSDVEGFGRVRGYGRDSGLGVGGCELSAEVDSNGWFDFESAI